MSVAFLLGETFDGLKKKSKKETFVAESNSQNKEVLFPPFFRIDEAVWVLHFSLLLQRRNIRK